MLNSDASIILFSTPLVLYVNGRSAKEVTYCSQDAVEEAAWQMTWKILAITVIVTTPAGHEVCNKDHI